MNNLMRKQNNQWDLFGGFDPFEKWSREMNRMFGFPFFAGHKEFLEGDKLNTNLYTEGNNLIVQSNIPGLKPENISVNVKDNILTIDAENKSTENENNKNKKFYRNERIQTRYHQTISLPAKTQIDKITADYKEGVLTIRLPKAEDSSKKQICVKCDESK